MRRNLETLDLVDIRAEVAGNIIKALPLLSADGVKAAFIAIDKALDKFAMNK